MQKTTLFLAWQKIDEEATEPPFSRAEQGRILNYDVLNDVSGFTNIETDRGWRILPVDAADFAVFARSLEDFSVIGTSDLDMLERRIAAVNKSVAVPPVSPPATSSKAVARYLRAGPGPLPGH